MSRQLFFIVIYYETLRCVVLYRLSYMLRIYLKICNIRKHQVQNNKIVSKLITRINPTKGVRQPNTHFFFKTQCEITFIIHLISTLYLKRYENIELCIKSFYSYRRLITFIVKIFIQEHFTRVI